MLGIFMLFYLLFRNIILAIIGVVPNFIAAFFILGIIGLVRNTFRYDDDYYSCNNNWYSCR